MSVPFDKLAERLHSRGQRLSPALRRVGEFIDDNRLEAMTKSAAELATAIGTSDATVIRALKAYPIYNAFYRRGLAAVREFLKTIPNLQLAGRNGQHRYNNQDHSMLAGLLAARNVLGANFNLWDLNTDQDFQEEGISLTDEELLGMEASQPLVPELAQSDASTGA